MAKNRAKGVWENGQIIKKKKKNNPTDKKQGTDFFRESKTHAEPLEHCELTYFNYTDPLELNILHKYLGIGKAVCSFE